MNRLFAAILAASALCGSAQHGMNPSTHQSAEDKDMSAYLMVFFTDPTHDLFMATSPDGYNFTAINDNKPVIAGDSIAEQKGIRDPHISRGPDGAFYLAMTDLHIFAKDKGLRDTQWNVPAKNTAGETIADLCS